MDERIKAFDEKMTKTMDVLAEDYASIRAGRANPHLLDKLRVDYYGTPSPLNAVANISVPEARIIQIQPWESKLIKDIEKCILASDIGITPSNDGKIIRLVFPELTEDRRKDLAKDIKKKAENAKVAIRNIRRDANDSLILFINNRMTRDLKTNYIRIENCTMANTAKSLKVAEKQVKKLKKIKKANMHEKLEDKTKRRIFWNC